MIGTFQDIRGKQVPEEERVQSHPQNEDSEELICPFPILSCEKTTIKDEGERQNEKKERENEGGGERDKDNILDQRILDPSCFQVTNPSHEGSTMT